MEIGEAVEFMVQLTPNWNSVDASHELSEQLWDTEAQPALRLLWIGLLMLLPVSGMLIRLCLLKQLPSETFPIVADEQFVHQELITASDGRILSSDGIVLAQDRQRFDLLVEYRWLETPMNALWKRRISRRLLKSDQTLTTLSDAQAQIERQQQILWQQLEGLCQQHGTKPFSQVRESIQNRIEKIHASVLKRQQAKTGNTQQPVGEDQSWLSLWSELNRGEPQQSAPLIIKEELIAHAVLEDVPVDVVARIEANRNVFPGVQFEILPERVYPRRHLAAHVIGLRKPVAGKQAAIETEDQKVQRFQVREGQGGVEQSFNHELAARPGMKQKVTDTHGDLIQEKPISPAVAGKDIVLTIDSQLQQVAERSLQIVCDQSRKRLAGCVLVADIYSGELLVAADYPTPDLFQLSANSEQYWQEMLNDPRSPLFPRLSHSRLPPGELFQWITYAAALESGASEDLIMQCSAEQKGFKNFLCTVDHELGTGHGEIRLLNAVQHNCVHSIAKLAVDLGGIALVDFATHCGFGQPTGVELPAEKSGSLPVEKLRDPEQKWTVRQTMELATGRTEVLITPMQWLQWISMVGNQGQKVPLHLVREMREANSMNVASTLLPQPLQVLQASTANSLARAMKNNVGLSRADAEEQPKQFEAKALAGKGLPNGAHAWYSSFFPAQSPKYAIVVVVEHGESLELTAIPIARELMATMKEHNWYSE